MADQPSIRHCFAIALRKTATIAPAPTMFALASGKHRNLLAAVLQDAKQMGADESDGVDVAAIAVSLRRIEGHPTVVITLPPPFRCPDPQMIALVLSKKVRGEVRRSSLEGGTITLFTLEEPPDLPERPPTMLCSLDTDGTHYNHGAGTARNTDAFCELVRRVFSPMPWWKFW